LSAARAQLRPRHQPTRHRQHLLFAAAERSRQLLLTVFLSRPSNLISPLATRATPEIAFITVLLPAPFEPRQLKPLPQS
jgi:hypothetical protein